MSTQLFWPFIILQIVTIIAIVFFLRMYMHKQMERSVQRIKKIDKETVQKEIQLNERKQKLEEEYSTKLSRAHKEAEELVQTAKEDVKNMRETERAKAKEEAKKIIKNALEEKERYIKESDKVAFNKAVDIAVDILKRTLDAKDLDLMRTRSVNEAVDTVLGSEDVGKLIKGSDTVEVITCSELSDKDRSGIQARFDDVSGGKTSIEFKIDADTGGGIILKIGESIIDCSLSARIRKTAAAVREEGM